MDNRQSLEAVIADWRERTLAALPIEEVAEMYRRMKAEQAAALTYQPLGAILRITNRPCPSTACSVQSGSPLAG